jgi:hypothetical protein
VEWTHFRPEVNVAKVVSRRPERHHAKVRGAGAPAPVAPAGEPLPDVREGLAYDPWDRAGLRDRFLDGPLSAQALAYRALEERGDFADAPYTPTIEADGGVLVRRRTVRTPAGPRAVAVQKPVRFDVRGRLRVQYEVTACDLEVSDVWLGVESHVFLPGLVEGRGQIAPPASPTAPAAVSSRRAGPGGPWRSPGDGQRRSW